MNDSILDIIRNYFSSQPILKAWVFGSYSRGEQTEDSDIDILVDFDHENATIGLMEYVRIMNGLSALLHRKVDLVENGTLLPFAAASADHDKISWKTAIKNIPEIKVQIQNILDEELSSTSYYFIITKYDNHLFFNPNFFAK